MEDHEDVRKSIAEKVRNKYMRPVLLHGLFCGSTHHVTSNKIAM